MSPYRLKKKQKEGNSLHYNKQINTEGITELENYHFVTVLVILDLVKKHQVILKVVF